MTDWTKIKYFRFEEFAEPERLRPGMAAMLDELREAYGYRLQISSSYRDSSKNQAVGGAKRSAHLSAADGLYSGVDLAIVPGRDMIAAERFRLVDCALKIGFRRIGVYPRHVHLDIEQDLPQRVLWIGED